mmetsp:Transcript_48143/g.111509  ORF Transcript_48143/g.111509 Transcript_48143/m.111509 type:complete len:80 (-) Transcript_48143:116-355(-)
MVAWDSPPRFLCLHSDKQAPRTRSADECASASLESRWPFMSGLVLRRWSVDVHGRACVPGGHARAHMGAGGPCHSDRRT